MPQISGLSKAISERQHYTVHPSAESPVTSVKLPVYNHIQRGTDRHHLP